jgi:hypothetical protein
VFPIHRSVATTFLKRVPNLNYVVRLTEQEPIQPFVPQSAHDVDKAKKMTQALQIIFNNVLISTMMCHGKSPKTYYLKDCVQAESPDLLHRQLYEKFYGRHSQETLAPSVGLQLAVRCGDGGNLLVTADTNVGWWHRSNYTQDLNKAIPLLRLEHGTWTLAGVKIDNINKPIYDEKTKEKIMTALKRRTFHVSYCIKSTDMDEGKFVALCCLSNFVSHAPRSFRYPTCVDPPS